MILHCPDRGIFVEDLVAFAQVRGLFVGGCVSRGEGSAFRRMAHAHNSRYDPFFGWICYRGWKRLANKTLLLHEIAHILSPGHGHDRAWRLVVRSIGGRVRYAGQRRRRKVFVR